MRKHADRALAMLPLIVLDHSGEFARGLATESYYSSPRPTLLPQRLRLLGPPAAISATGLSKRSCGISEESNAVESFERRALSGASPRDLQLMMRARA